MTISKLFLIGNKTIENVACIPDFHVFNLKKEEDDFGVNNDEEEEDNDNEMLNLFRKRNVRSEEEIFNQ